MIRKILSKALNSVGLYRNPNFFTMNAALERSVKRGLQVQTVVDIGASDGRWSLDCMHYIPNARYLMIEAQQPHGPALKKVCEQHPNMDFVLAAAGDQEGKIYFDNSGLFGGLASKEPLQENCIEVPVVTIDAEVKRKNLKGPYLIKLDTHGFEVPILEGARETLKNASLVIIEAYNYKLTDTSLRYFEMCEYMNKLGFYTIEMVDFMLRQRDSSLWQMDLFFIPKSDKAFQHNSFD